MRSNLDSFLCHDERAIQQSKIAHCAATILADGKRATGITGTMLSEDNGARIFAPEKPKDLRALAIKAFSELDVRRNGMSPPIVLHSPVWSYVAHCG
jgi:uncharacterized linocin/CFP29 family protein